MRAEFRASPQHILSSKGPFFFYEPVEFTLAEPISKHAAEIFGSPRRAENAPSINAIAAGKPQRRVGAQERIVARETVGEGRRIAVRQVAAGQNCAGSPSPFCGAQERRELFQRMLGEAPVG